MDTGKVNAKKRAVFKDEKGRTFVKQGDKKVYVKKLFTPVRDEPAIVKSPMTDTGKVDAKKRKVFKDSKGRTYVKPADKKVFVKKLFTPKAVTPPVIVTSPVADTGKLNAKKRKVFTDTKGRTYVKQDDKKVYVKKLFTPKIVPKFVRKATPKHAPMPVPSRPAVRTRKSVAPKKLLKIREPWKATLPERFFCASQGLQQKTNTCWFNAALNGIALSSTTSELLLKDMKKLDKQQIIKISDMKLDESCPKELSKQFVYAYALRIHEESMQNKTRNESRELVEKMFTPGRLASPVVRGEAGYYSLDAVAQILWRVFPDKKMVSVGTLAQAKAVAKDVSFLIFDTVVQRPSDVHLRIGDYHLSHLVYIVSREGSSTYHAVLAYICDKVKSVYDSNKRSKLDIEWNLLKNGKKILEYSGAKAFHGIAYCLYIKK
jgi:hypothetical protein